MLHCVLFRPAIAQNVGSIARTCLAFGFSSLHIVEPLFDLTAHTERSRLSRGSVGYAKVDGVFGDANTILYSSCEDFIARSAGLLDSSQYFVFSKHARHGVISIDDWRISTSTDGLGPVICAFGSESSGIEGIPVRALRGSRCVYIPMAPSVRSLNVAATVAIALHEASRQLRAPRNPLEQPP
jgi:tRNA (cytidine/uridine-2'-O-)-methyltransferase